jgi:phage terminase large subunit
VKNYSKANTELSPRKKLTIQEYENRVAVDPILPVNAFFDIGGAGHSSDAMAIWIAQFVGREIRLLDYIEGVGQPLAYYAHELRRRGWKDVIVYLPHDGVARNNISGKRYIDHWIEAGFECGALSRIPEPVPR